MRVPWSNCGSNAIGHSLPALRRIRKQGLPTKELEKVEATASVGLDNDKWHLSITIANRSTWTITQSKAFFIVTRKDGGVRSFNLRIRKTGDAEMEIAPRSEYSAYCYAVLPSEAQEYFKAESVQKWEWALTETKGHRTPINLVKKPIDWISWLFTRADESQSK